MQNTDNKMGSQPVTKMLFGISIPIICSMMIQALYNVVDSMYVAHISGNALTAVSIVFPFQLLMIALATGSGVGINVVVSSFLGKKDLVNAGKAAKNSMIVGCMNFMVLGISGFFLADQFVNTQTGIGSMINDSASYMKIIAGASFGYFLSIVYERLLQSTGKTILGVAGAAWATVFAQTVSMLFGYINLVFPAFSFRRSALLLLFLSIVSCCNLQRTQWLFMEYAASCRISSLCQFTVGAMVWCRPLHTI